MASGFPISMQAVSRHIRVLQTARSADWLEARRRLEGRFARLDELLEQTKGTT